MKPKPYTLEGVRYYPQVSRDYQDARVEAGFCEGRELPACDRYYIRIYGQAESKLLLHMTKDEMLALAWVIVGAVWSEEVDKR